MQCINQEADRLVKQADQLMATTHNEWLKRSISIDTYRQQRLAATQLYLRAITLAQKDHD